MPTHCCVPLCTQNGYVDESAKKVSFHRFPKLEEVYRKWIIAIKRDEGTSFKVSKATKVCSRHFVESDFVRNVANGHRLLYEHAVPSVFSFKKPQVVRKPPKQRTSTVPQATQPEADLLQPEADLQQSEDTTTAPELPDEDPGASPVPMEPPVCTCSLEPELELRRVAERKLHSEIELLRNELKETKAEVYRLKAELQRALANCKVLEEKNVPFSIEKFQESDEDIQFYTGLPNYGTFIAFLELIDAGENGKNIIMRSGVSLHASEKAGRPRKLSAKNQLFLVLVKLKGGMFHKHLGHLFDISVSTVSKLFSAWMSFLYLHLTNLALWLPRETIDGTMPPAFREKYPTTRVILDATEIRCEVTSSFVTQSGTYSYYKSTNTFKGLVGISPNGLVTFVSELFMGSVSDKETVIQSGLLEMPFDKGDSVMADKGFKIADLLQKLGVALNIPPFLNRGKFSTEEVVETQDIAALRIHVERRIQRIKSFHIFDRPIPISLAPLANQIWTVCTVLTNMQSPLIRDSE
ncbi:uncharacterized protein LOC115313765 [Ixodes scapularis]|uniref:uncharacterized protein LOC115322880 n=1 Tax=Ixodes scapularis TaxID=6945 RepID=UPI001A9CD3E2|nr:uncharacterized protein LOC115322880 [Ixodes scapularis]XP_040078055.1 uncharacterized protein LOC115313765 [Ixodes scapularis]